MIKNGISVSVSTKGRVSGTTLLIQYPISLNNAPKTLTFGNVFEAEWLNGSVSPLTRYKSQFKFSINLLMKSFRYILVIRGEGLYIWPRRKYDTLESVCRPVTQLLRNNLFTFLCFIDLYQFTLLFCTDELLFCCLTIYSLVYKTEGTVIVVSNFSAKFIE